MNELLKVVNAEKKKLKSKIPIAVKISPDIEDDNIEKISEALIEYEISAAIISNTTDKNRENLKNINKFEKGGLSGKPLEAKSNILINKFHKILKNKIKIIGVGGVDSGQSAYEKLVSGASIIQLYTGMIYKGPKIATKINQELIKILYKERVKNISDLVGIKN